jgi:hypothetical protein
MGNDSRVYYAPSVAWSDAVLFVYNPEDAPWWPSRLPDRPRQAALLDGIRDDLETRKRARGETRFPPLVIAVSKADLLQPRPEFDGDEADVRAVVEKLGDKSMITAAERWEDVAWRFIAPAPADASPQKGVTELFRLLLSLLRD